MSQLVAAAPAYAYEDQLTIGVGVGYAYSALEGGPHNGAVISLDTSWGLDQNWSVRGLLGYAMYPTTKARATLNAAAELLYLVDVVELVPYAGVGVDALGELGGRRADDDFRMDFAVHPVLGIDWLTSRDLVLGLQARPLFVLTNFDRQPLVLTVMLTGSLLLDR